MAHALKPGHRAIFQYPAAFSDSDGCGAHRGQMVTIVRPLTDDECEPDQQPMYRIQADDGWQGDAWEEEIDGGEPSTVAVGKNGKLTFHQA